MYPEYFKAADTEDLKEKAQLHKAQQEEEEVNRFKETRALQVHEWM
jgi:hypothetical protein